VRREVLIAHIVLDKAGALVGAGVTSSSGVEAIDDPALETIRRAASFDNPPQSLVGPDGNIHFEHELFL
jgi:TonB family protein